MKYFCQAVAKMEPEIQCPGAQPRDPLGYAFQFLGEKLIPKGKRLFPTLLCR